MGTWVALDADSKLEISYFVGNRYATYKRIFMNDLSGRLKNRVQLTPDGFRAYLEAIEESFGADIDFAQLVKMYGKPIEGELRYSPGQHTGAVKTPITGNPKMKYNSTSYVGRQNLAMRMNMTRFTRLTNAFSKKVENQPNAGALHFIYYNYCRIHKTLRVSPLMATGIEDHLFSVEDLAKFIWC